MSGFSEKNKTSSGCLGSADLDEIGPLYRTIEQRAKRDTAA